MVSLTELESIKVNAIKNVIAREGGYVNHKDDNGGATNYGITQATAKKHGYFGDMKNYTIEQAINVYKTDYWQRLNLDEVCKISPFLAVCLFDFGVNSGTAAATKHLQKLLNVLNNKGQDYNDIKVDGGLGNNTLSALKQFYNVRRDHGIKVLSESLNSLRIAFCVGISEKNESQESFTFGWLSRIVEI